MAYPKLPPHVGEESHGTSQSPVKLYDADQMRGFAADAVQAFRALVEKLAKLDSSFDVLDLSMEAEELLKGLPQ